MSEKATFDSGTDEKRVQPGAASVDSESGAASTDSLRLREVYGGVYAAGGSLASYEPIAKYEGKHRYDPKFEWTEGEEKRLIRRVCLLFPCVNSWL